MNLTITAFGANNGNTRITVASGDTLELIGTPITNIDASDFIFG